jgi:dienelactone hydrolase
MSARGAILRLLLVAALLGLFGLPSKAEEIVQFASLEDNGPGQPSTILNGYLFRPNGGGPHPAVVGLHGCSGMLVPNTDRLTGLYRAWGTELSNRGYVVLLVDSLAVRQHGEMCSIRGLDAGIYRKRPRDAYAALRYLQSQPFVRADRVGVIGWSQGGGVTLYSIADRSMGRPAELPQGDFRVAVAFYPGACNEARQPGWTSRIPLLVLTGDADVWTPMAPCKAFVDAAVARGNTIEMQIYPGAYHAFDAPNRARTELPAYITRAGVVPIVGTDPAARQDAFARVPAFLARYLDR